MSRSGRCEKFRLSAWPSEIRKSVAADFRSWIPSIVELETRFGHISAARAVGNSIRLNPESFRTPRQAFRRSTTRKASRKVLCDVIRRRLGPRTKGPCRRTGGFFQLGRRWGANRVRPAARPESGPYFLRIRGSRCCGWSSGQGA
jgi:hypothetical protein